MNNKGPVIIVEDNEVAQQLLIAIFEDMECPNDLIFFTDVDEALEFLEKTPVIPFLILSDVNLTTETGFTLKKRIHENLSLQLKSIPFIFFSTSASKKDVEMAFNLGCQCFFIKPSSLEKLKEFLSSMMNYWGNSLAPHDM